MSSGPREQNPWQPVRLISGTTLTSTPAAATAVFSAARTSRLPTALQPVPQQTRMQGVDGSMLSMSVCRYWASSCGAEIFFVQASSGAVLVAVAITVLRYSALTVSMSSFSCATVAWG